VARQLTTSTAEIGTAFKSQLRKNKSPVVMGGDRKSIFLCLLVVIKTMGIATSLDSNETIAALDATGKIFQSDPSNVSLQQQRLDEIRALTAMQSRAAAERDAHDKIARNIREAADRQSAEAADRLSAALSVKDALNLPQKENIREAADRQSAEAADRLSDVLSTKNSLNLSQEVVPESAPEEVDSVGSKVAATFLNSAEELSAPHQVSAPKVTMEHSEGDREAAHTSVKDLNSFDPESAIATPEVIVDAVTSETFYSVPSDINNKVVDDEDVDHEDDVMKEVTLDLL
jgi:hypothetical protein